jgi:NAD+ kinase
MISQARPKQKFTLNELVILCNQSASTPPDLIDWQNMPAVGNELPNKPLTDTNCDSIQPMFKTILLIGKYFGASAGSPATAQGSRRAVLDVLQALSRLGCEVVLERQTALGVDLEGDAAYSSLSLAAIQAGQIDLAVVVGGDGTMLAAARQLAAIDVPVIGINQGRLGFITDIALDDFEQTLLPMLKGAFVTEQRHLLHGEVMRKNAAGIDECAFSAIAMNDVVINRSATAGMVELRIAVDGKFVANQRADGLIVSTPTGSTAYALSAGGSLLHPSVGGWILVPIAPHNLSNRPIVLPDNCVIEIELLSDRDASVNFDMQSLTGLLQGDRIVVRRAPHSAQFLHPLGWNYFDSLRHKLHWNES